MIEAGRIQPLARIGRRAHRLDLSGHWLLPGLVNAHDHLGHNLFPPGPAAGAYRHADDWIADMRRLLASDVYAALRRIPMPQRAWHGAVKNLISGVTSVLHHDPWLSVFERRDFPLRVLDSPGWVHSPSLAGRYGPGLEEGLAARRPGRPWVVHAAEGIGRRARRDFDRIEALGGLDPRTRLVHAVGLDAARRGRALAAGCGMIWCPASNRRLFGRAADPVDFAAARRLALGSDARLTGSRDLLDELGHAAADGRLRPLQLLRMVTLDAAALCGRSRAGRIDPGAPADLIVLADQGRSPIEQLLASRRSDLQLILRAGRVMLAAPELAERLDPARDPLLRARLDGRPRRIAAGLLEPLVPSGLIEPGFHLEPAGAATRRPA